MKIFRSVLEELNSDGEDLTSEDEAPDLDNEVDFDNAQVLENFLSKPKFRDVHQKWICKKHFTQICYTCFTKNQKIN